MGTIGEDRLANIAKGENLGSRPGRILRNRFELQPSRVAYNRPEGLLRGKQGDIHMSLMARNMPDFPKEAAEGIDLRNPAPGPLSKQEKAFWRSYENLPDDVLDDWHDTSGFTGRSGTFIPREEAPGTLGGGESIRMGELEKEKQPSVMKAQARAESIYTKDQDRRRLRADRAKQGLKSMEEERSWLSRISKFAEEGSPNIGRIQTLTSRIGKLKNAARRAGVMGMNAAALGLAAPFTTGEALMNLRSDDPNQQKKSVETLLGMPDGSTGRGMTQDELEANPGYQDPVSGKGYL